MAAWIQSTRAENVLFKEKKKEKRTLRAFHRQYDRLCVHTIFFTSEARQFILTFDHEARVILPDGRAHLFLALLFGGLWSF